MNTDPTAEFIAQLAAHMGGTIAPQENDRLPGIRFENPRCIMFIRSSWDARPKWRAYITAADGKNIHRAASANFNGKRPLHDIGADLRRRVLEASRQAIRDHGKTAAEKQTKEREIQDRVQHLETAAQAVNDKAGYHNHFVRLPGFTVASEYHLSADRHGFTAEVTVHSFECLLMIARLVAEDRRIYNATRQD